jgi:hypothetical protein
MRTHLILVPIALTVVTLAARGQGTFVYDQQSSTNETAFFGTGGVMQQIAQPWGQSFTPGLSSVDFIRLKLYDNNTNNGLGATLSVNLRAGSISGSLLGSTDPVFIPNGTGGTVDFVFPGAISVTPGVVYFFEPVVQSGDLWRIDSNEYNYAGGSVFAGGLPVSGSDLWFREGIIVPEPASAWLLVPIVGILAWRHRKWHNS